MTKRLVRLYVTEIAACRWCPAAARGLTFRCTKRATHGGLPLNEDEARAIPDPNRIPRWCPLQTRKR